MKIQNSLTDVALLEEIGRRVARSRIMRGMTQAELAVRSGISRFAISRLENGAGGVRIENFFSVLRQLDVLSRMETVLEPLDLSPIQEAELEARRLVLPKRVRSKKSTAGEMHLARRWGDGVEIARK